MNQEKINSIVYQLTELNTADSRFLVNEIRENPEDVDWANLFEFLLLHARVLQSSIIKENSEKLQDSIEFFIAKGLWPNLANCFRSLPSGIKGALLNSTQGEKKSEMFKDLEQRYTILEKIVLMSNDEITQLNEYYEENVKTL